MTHSGHSSGDRVAGIAALWPVRGRSVGGFLGDQLFDFRLPLKCRISLVIRRVGIFLMRRAIRTTLVFPTINLSVEAMRGLSDACRLSPGSLQDRKRSRSSWGGPALRG